MTVPSDSEKINKILDILEKQSTKNGEEERNAEKIEKLIGEYGDKARSLQRNYLIVFGLTVSFLLLFSFPYLSADYTLDTYNIAKKASDDTENLLKANEFQAYLKFLNSKSDSAHGIGPKIKNQSEASYFNKTTNALKTELSRILGNMDPLKSRIVYDRTLNNFIITLRSNLTSLADNLNSSESVTYIEKSISKFSTDTWNNTQYLKDIKDKSVHTFAGGFSTPIGPITVSFIQVQMLLPVGIATGLIIISVQCAELMRLCRFINRYRVQKPEIS